MLNPTRWEYRVQTFGGVLKLTKDEDLEAALNDWGEEGWEVVSTHTIENSYKVCVIARRLQTHASRRRRSLPGLA